LPHIRRSMPARNPCSSLVTISSQTLLRSR
jgi:hypothetical protein